MKFFKTFINIVIWGVLSFYLVLTILLHIPQVQTFLGNRVAAALGTTLGTKVEVGRVDLGFLNRLIIDDVRIYDQQSKEMLRASRLSVKLDPMELTDGRIRISSAQIFSAHCKFYQPSADAKPNFQFLLDSLSSDDTASEKPLDLRINTLIMRHSSVEWHRHDKPRTPGRFNPDHLHISNISTHVLLPVMRDDSISMQIKKLSLEESSGLKVERMAFRFEGGRSACHLSEFRLKMPQTDVQIEHFNATYQTVGDSLIENTLRYKGNFYPSTVTPADFSFLLPSLKDFQSPLMFCMKFKGSAQELDIPTFSIFSQTGEINVNIAGRIADWKQTPVWHLKIDDMDLSEKTVNFVFENLKGKKVELPALVSRLGDVNIKGIFSGNKQTLIASTCHVNAGGDDIDIAVSMGHDKHFNGHISTPGINLGKILDEPTLGIMDGKLELKGSLAQPGQPIVAAKGAVRQFHYNNYTYHNIDIDAAYSSSKVEGRMMIDDPNVKLHIDGLLSLAGKKKNIQVNADVADLVPAAIHLSDQWGQAHFATRINAHFTASGINDAQGTLNVSDFTMLSDNKEYMLKELNVESGYEDHTHYLILSSDFASAYLRGNFNYETLGQSFIKAIGSRLPTIPGLPGSHARTSNDFELRASITKTDWLEALFDVPLRIERNIALNARMDDRQNDIQLNCDLPSFSYNGTRYRRGRINITSPNDSLCCHIRADKLSDNNARMRIDVKGTAINNKLTTSLAWDNFSKKAPMNGEVNAVSQFYIEQDNKQTAHIQIKPSKVSVAGAEWTLKPADVYYSKKNIRIENFTIEHDKQHIIANGCMSDNPSDSLTVDLHDINVDYVLNLVDFDAVSFSGLASGKAYISAPFGDMNAKANLLVRNFLFENGRMGTLDAQVDWNKQEKQIDIHAIANDGPDAMTYINGYVSPERNYIDLGVRAEGTHLDFMHSFTQSFISHVDGHVRGEVRLIGPLNTINLTGRLVVDGNATVKPLNCTYHLDCDTVVLVPDEILIHRQPLFDKYNHQGFLSGAIHHKHLTKMTYDLQLEAKNLLAYDFQDFGDETFYGTVFGTGNISLSGRRGRLTVDIDVMPEDNSTFVYNASNPDAIADQKFITWRTKDEKPALQAVPSLFDRPIYSDETVEEKDDNDIRTDIYLNFKINCTPRATLRLLMDSKTNDYITLNGNGMLLASYYNKGAFNMFGTYTVDHGTYGLTIQNIIKKNFTFNEGGTIAFGGNPYDATLNLQAIHTVNGVSLSDLNIGNSFTSNTIRVNCLMNIQGQPRAPKVTFDLDMPTVGSDEKQMIRSIINSDDEMNQQVLYLLGIGRFYPQGANNATTQDERQQSQTTLAMQSLLSGTLSAQLNSMLSTMINSNKWNFGANISTGNEGWNNAEYEGLVSGRLLNNRLLINGQFGYRDKATTNNPSFIGDFDVRYLLFPNGNLALKVYNQTNDRYFTKSSLNTQGIGLIMKKDFNGLSDLFGIKKQKGAEKKPAP